MLLSESPELLPGDEAERPLVIASEFPVAFGYIDLVGVSASGAITVVECKLHTNSEIRRTVVGQLLAYAASLWELSFEEFDERWRQAGRPALLDDLTAAAEAQGQTLDQAAIRATVEENLSAGRYRLIVAVDDITPELQRIIEYLSEHTVADVGVIALELGYVADGETQVLVPQSYGVEMARQKATRRAGGHQWDETSFFAALREDPGEWAVPIGRALFDWTGEHGLRVWYGTGAKQATMAVGLDDASGKRRAVMTGYSPGGVVLQFDSLKLLPPFDEPEARAEFRARLGAIDGLDAEGLPDTWPTVHWDLLRPDAALRIFLATYEWAVERIREAAS